MEKNYMVVDLGTGNTRVAVVSSTGTIHAVKAFENNYHRDEAYEDALYFIPEEWAVQILDYCKDIVAENPKLEITAVISSGARESIVLYNEDGKAFYGLPNIDNRGRAWVSDIPDKKYIYERTGRWVTEDFPAAKLLGLQKKHPQIYSQVFKITSLSEWIAEIFTGKIVIEPSQACETQLFDIEKRQWSEKICKYYNINTELLPPIQIAGTCLAKVKPELCEKLQLSIESVFIIGGADTQIAVKGTGIEVGDIAIVSGTTSPVVTITDEKFYDKEERCWTGCNLGGETFQVETNPGVTGLNYQRLKKMFFTDISHEKLDQILQDKKRFLCTASFSTLNFYKKQSFKKGGFIMGTPLDAACDVTDLAWAMVADIACSIYVQYKSLCEMVPHSKSYLLGCGGGLQSSTMCQMIADLTDKDLVIYDGFEHATIIGCVNLCNDYFRIDYGNNHQDEKRYIPQKDSLVKTYYPEWEKNRSMLNPES
ncbi:MAG: carbohydrate kinase [Firmicutes bacterium HGW-Firmicutes-7]|nr:MAG: carbohydrate kinase [Firmicutes bacterium HGW-Firmicutes-7]